MKTEKDYKNLINISMFYQVEEISDNKNMNDTMAEDNFYINENCEESFGFDLDIDEDEVIKRYETMFVLFVNRKGFLPLEKPLTTPRGFQPTVVGWAVMYAIQGKDCVGNRLASMQWTALVSSLLLTISIPFYVSPPSFNNDDTSHIFSALIGFSAFSHITVILGLQVMETFLQRPCTEADLMLARYDSIGYDMGLNILMVIACLLFLAAVMVAGFDRDFVDGAIHLYITVGVVVLIYVLVVATGVAGDKYQDMRAFQFYKAYCDPNGRLKEHYRKRVYEKRTTMTDNQAKVGLATVDKEYSFPYYYLNGPSAMSDMTSKRKSKPSKIAVT